MVEDSVVDLVVVVDSCSPKFSVLVVVFSACPESWLYFLQVLFFCLLQILHFYFQLKVQLQMTEYLMLNLLIVQYLEQNLPFSRFLEMVFLRCMKHNSLHSWKKKSLWQYKKCLEDNHKVLVAKDI